MKRAVLFICLLLTSCSVKHAPPMPQLFPVSLPDASEEICGNVFLKGNWQFVHSITFTMNGGHGTTLVGITVLQEKKLKTVLMGVEGFVLFEAEQEESGKLVIKRAMQPFDRKGFAEGLMCDVRTLFREPDNSRRVLARNLEGELVCRYTAQNNQVIDVMTATKGWNRIALYDTNGVLQQLIIASNYKEVAGESMPETIKLKSLGIQDYSLELQLLSAEIL